MCSYPRNPERQLFSSPFRKIQALKALNVEGRARAVGGRRQEKCKPGSMPGPCGLFTSTALKRDPRPMVDSVGAFFFFSLPVDLPVPKSRRSIGRVGWRCFLSVELFR